MIGIIGSRSDAETVRQEVRQYIEQTLKLTIAEEKSHIRPSRQGVNFVGYWVKTYSGTRVVKLKMGTRYTTRKTVSERLQLHIPPSTLQKFCAAKRYGDYQTTKARHKTEFTVLSDTEIILAYNGELRGLANYYALAHNVKRKMSKLAYLWRTSLFKTLAKKHKQRVNAIAKRLQTEDGYALTVREEQKIRTTRFYRLKDLHPPLPSDRRIDTPPNTFALTLSRSELLRRWNTRQCEYCETTEGPFQVHHIRKMKDVANGKEPWQKMMTARCRKTLILCARCHQLLHAGKLPDKEYLKAQVRGEPCALKGASTVRREGDG